MYKKRKKERDKKLNVKSLKMGRYDDVTEQKRG